MQVAISPAKLPAKLKKPKHYTYLNCHFINRGPQTTWQSIFPGKMGTQEFWQESQAGKIGTQMCWQTSKVHFGVHMQTFRTFFSLAMPVWV